MSNDSFMNWGFKPVDRDTKGWLYEVNIDWQDEYNWNKYEHTHNMKYYLKWENAFNAFMTRLERDRNLLVRCQEKYFDECQEEGWVAFQFEGEGGYYGEIEAFPTIYHLVENKIIPPNVIMDVDDLELALQEGLNPGACWSLMRGYYPKWVEVNLKSNPKSGNLVASYEQEHPQHKFHYDITRWEGPKWEDGDINEG